MTTPYSEQTRIAIVGKGTEFVFDLVSSVLDFVGKPIDKVKFENTIGHHKNDFVLMALEENSPIFKLYQPTIAVITDFSESYPEFIQSITSGGILIYNQENSDLQNTVQNAVNYFRKIPYQQTEYQIHQQKVYMDTELGMISVTIKEENIPLVETSRLLCQQLGIQEEEFYEALLNY